MYNHLYKIIVIFRLKQDIPVLFNKKQSQTILLSNYNVYHVYIKYSKLVSLKDHTVNYFYKTLISPFNRANGSM